MVGRRASGTHYHGHVQKEPLAGAEIDRNNYEATLESPEDAVKWMAAELRTATGNPDMTLDDETAVWLTHIRAEETISTGLQNGPTITAAPMPDGSCWCRSANLQPV